MHTRHLYRLFVRPAVNREWPLAVALLVLAVICVLAALLLPGVFAADAPTDDRPGVADVRELSISHGTVGGETVPLTVDARLRHRGGTSRNLSVTFRAVDLDSGLQQRLTAVPVDPVEGNREVAVHETLTVPREGAYRIEAILYQDGERRSVGSKEVHGLSSLEPDYAASNVTFHRFGAGGTAPLPVLEYYVESVAENRSRLGVSTHLTNRGATPADDYRLVVKARQVDSNIVADEKAVQVGPIGPGRTAAPGVSLGVPDGYNYYLDAVLWRDGVVVETARSAANLDPSETVSVNETRRDVGLEVGEFERGEAGDPDAGGRPPETTAVESAGPGFGFVLGLVGLLVAAGLLVKRGDHRD